MDMYEVVRGGGFDNEAGYLRTTTYGTPLEVLSSSAFITNGTETVTYKLPAYIKSESQVEVTRENVLLKQGIDYSVDLPTQSLTVSYTTRRNNEVVYTIVLRG